MFLLSVKTLVNRAFIDSFKRISYSIEELKPISIVKHRKPLSTVRLRRLWQLKKYRLFSICNVLFEGVAYPKTYKIYNDYNDLQTALT